MRPGESGTLIEIRGLRHHVHEGSPETHAGPVLKYRASHKHHMDRGHRLEHRLHHMGLAPGQTVTVVQNAPTGPVIVAVKDTRIGLAKGVAARLLVRPAPVGVCGSPGLSGPAGGG